MSELSDAGSYASIVGVLVSIGAIVYAYFIKREVNLISKKQKENAQGPYRINTIKNMSEIHDYFKNIIRITKNVDVENPELEESTDHDNVTAELNSYYDANKTKMNLLLDKSVRDLGAWYDLDKDVRPKLEEVIEDFRWLVNEFFKINMDQEMQTRIWTDNHAELLGKKYNIELILKANEKALS